MDFCGPKVAAIVVKQMKGGKIRPVPNHLSRFRQAESALIITIPAVSSAAV